MSSLDKLIWMTCVSLCIAALLVPTRLWSFIRTFGLSHSCQCAYTGVNRTPGQGRDHCIIHTNAVTLSNWSHEPGELEGGRCGCMDTFSLCLSVEIVLIIINDLWVWSVQTSRWSSPSEGKVNTGRDWGGPDMQLHCRLLGMSLI